MGAAARDAGEMLRTECESAESATGEMPCSLPAWTLPIATCRKIPFTEFANQESGSVETNRVVSCLRSCVHRIRGSRVHFPNSIQQCLHYSLHTPQNLAVAHLLSSLGCHLITLAHYKDAEKVLRRALSIGSARLGAGHPELSYSLDWLGLSLFLQGNYTEALLVCFATKDIVEKHMGEQHPNVCGCLLNMAAVYDGLGWFLYAWEMRDKAAKLYATMVNAESDSSSS